jgi:hypothetical protein
MYEYMYTFTYPYGDSTCRGHFGDFIGDIKICTYINKHTYTYIYIYIYMYVYTRIEIAHFEATIEISLVMSEPLSPAPTISTRLPLFIRDRG